MMLSVMITVRVRPQVVSQWPARHEHVFYCLVCKRVPLQRVCLEVGRIKQETPAVAAFSIWLSISEMFQSSLFVSYRSWRYTDLVHGRFMSLWLFQGYPWRAMS